MHTHHGIDLLDLYRGKISARKVLNLVRRLPRTSHYIAALADDDEVAAMTDLDAKPGPPPMTEFGPVVQALASLNDRVGELIRAVVAANSKKPPAKVPPYPRPVTAADRLRHRRRAAKHRALVARVLPHKRTDH